MRQVVEKMELDPETREVELQMRLPANCANQYEAAAGVAAICEVILLRRRFAFLAGKARRPQRLRELWTRTGGVSSD